MSPRQCDLMLDFRTDVWARDVYVSVTSIEMVVGLWRIRGPRMVNAIVLRVVYFLSLILSVGELPPNARIPSRPGIF